MAMFFPFAVMVLGTPLPTGSQRGDSR